MRSPRDSPDQQLRTTARSDIRYRRLLDQRGNLVGDPARNSVAGLVADLLQLIADALHDVRGRCRPQNNVLSAWDDDWS